MRQLVIVMMSAAIMACSNSPDLGSAAPGGSAGGPTKGGLTEWPESQQGQNPPPAPEQFEPIVSNGDDLANQLPGDVLNRLVDPTAFGYTINDITDPVIVEHMVRSSFAQLQDGSRLDHAYHWYGHPDENEAIAMIPVEFDSRYGTKLHGEIVLPYAGTGSPQEGPFPVIIALQGLNTNAAMYRWWHRLFADNGYLVFAFDFSGQGRSDDEGEGDPGNNLHEAQDAMTYLFDQSPVASVLNAEQVGVIGHSMGAAAVLRVQEQEAADAAEPNPVRIKAGVAAAPVFESVSSNPIPIMIQTGDHDGPIAPIPFINPAVVRPLYDSLEGDRAFIVAEAASHGQHTNYPLIPTSTWGRDIAADYSLAWMNYYLLGDQSALAIIEGGHPHLSFLHDSATRINDVETFYRGNGLVPDPAEFQ